MKLNIPTGNSKTDREVRRSIIKKRLAPWKGKTVKCPCLGNVPVLIQQKSIDEVAEHASKSNGSTMAALQMPAMIRKARFVRMTLPKDNNKQSRQFQFIFMYELESEFNGKSVKVMVGIREYPLMFLQYCITSVGE